MPPTRILIVANRTSTDPALIASVRRRATEDPDARFHLVVPATPRGLHRVVDPEDAGIDAARQRLDEALEVLGAAAGRPICGHIGDANPLSAVTDALHLEGVDTIIISTLSPRLSRWLRLDIVSKIRALGLPVEHVTAAQDEADTEATLEEVA